MDIAEPKMTWFLWKEQGIKKSANQNNERPIIIKKEESGYVKLKK